MKKKNEAAVELGRKGGSVSSEAKTEANRANAQKPRKDWARYEKARTLRAAGHTLKEIGSALGVTGSRARQMVLKAEMRNRWLEIEKNKKNSSDQQREGKSMNIYTVEVTITTVVAAEDERQAIGLVSLNLGDIRAEDENPRIIVGHELRSLSDLPPFWDGDSIPHGSEGFTTLRDLLAPSQ